MKKGRPHRPPRGDARILPGAGGTQRLPRLVGLSKAMDILLRGKAMGPEEALAIGLVDRLIEPEVFLDEVMNFAQQLASGAGKAMGTSRRRCARGSTSPGPGAGGRTEVRPREPRDPRREGRLAAFAEKRKPNFLSR